MKKTIIFLMVFLSLMLVSANEEYEQMGSNNSYFALGTGFFNAQLSETDDTTRALSNPSFVPLVSDLDNDGVSEIIALEGYTFRLYQGSGLSIVDSLALTNVSGNIFFMVYDYDGDNYKEILSIDSGTANINIVAYNGTAIYLEKTYAIGSSYHDDGEAILSCRDVDDCIAFTVYGNKVVGNDPLRATFFDSSSIDTPYILYTSKGGTFNYICYPQIPSVSVADYDNDGTDEYIISFIDVSDKSPELPEYLVIQYVDVTGGNIPYTKLNITDNIGEYSISSTNGCQEDVVVRYGGLITSPLVFDFDDSPSTGLETAVGAAYDFDEFKIYLYDKNGNLIDDYPETFQADGEIISNPILMNAFPDPPSKGRKDFCVLGHDATGERLDLLCGSYLTESLLHTKEYEFDLDNANLDNVPHGHWDFMPMAHAAQHSTETEQGANLDELVTSFGVFYLDATFTNFLIHIFENPYVNASVISVDAESVGREDLIALTKTNLWYLDDGYSNTAGQITEYSVNPCLDSTWKLNTSVGVTIKASDVDSDNVRARAILYYGSSNYQDSGWSSNGSSGTTFSFSFTANKTISTGTLRLIATDTYNPDVNDTLDLTFSVGSQGVEFGDCITSEEIELVTEEDGEAPSLPVTEDDNALVRGISFLGEEFNLGLGGNIIWLIIMAVIAYAVWTSGSFAHAGTAFGVIGIIEIIMLIVGGLLGILSTGIIVVFVVLAMVVMSVWFRRILTSKGD